MPSTVTVHYPFHPLHCRCLEVVAWPRQPHLAVTVRQPDGQTLKLPLWMVDPAAAHCELCDRVELTASVLQALIRLQYALAETAKLYGFRHIEVIDRDLGLSAASGAPAREGFKELLASIALGEVGLVLSRELSRLSRTDQDWCRLMELCRVFDTLLGDAENLYDLSRLDAQLVLGIKDTLSVVEFGTLKLRLQHGREAKASRGELGRCLAPGYVFDATAYIVKDPNLRVQEAIGLVFRKFNEVASIRQTYRWFHEAEVELPVNIQVTSG